MFYEDVNDLATWLTEPFLDRDGHYLGPPQPPMLGRWVDPEYLKPIENDEIFNGFSKALGL